MDYGLNGLKKERKNKNKNGKMVKRNGGKKIRPKEGRFFIFPG